MKSVEKTITNYNLIQNDDVIGVACSGGVDSMCLLHFLNSIKNELGCEVVAVTVDHGIRKESGKDAEFVVNYCQKNNIKVYKFKGNVIELSKNSGKTIEQAAREFRYNIFRSLIKDGKVTKIALGHHMMDQAETILLNIFRGSGLLGAAGMDYIREGVYIRPLLKTTKFEIIAYINANEIPYIEDATNQSNEYSRNYIRNLIMPLIRNKWKQADLNICSFGEICKIDDDYINSQIKSNMIVLENNNTVKIPVSYFVYEQSLINRIILKAVKEIGILSDIERKHINIIKNFALQSENGTKINLPNKLQALKEYNYITLTNKQLERSTKTLAFKTGKTDISNFGVIEIKKLKDYTIGEYTHLIDADKLPKNAVWRKRKNADVFKKFGSGTKSLSNYFTDIKVPRRLRDSIPVLAVENEILIVAGYEISNFLKVDNETQTAYGINVIVF